MKLSELRGLLDRATPGPWYARGQFLSLTPDASGMGATLMTNRVGIMADPDDAAAVAAMRTAMPTLIKIVGAALEFVEAQGPLARGDFAGDRFEVLAISIDRHGASL